MLEVRQILEPEIAALAAQRARPEDIEEMERILEEMEDRLNDHRYDDAVQSIIAFHRVITRATGNRLIQRLMDTIADLLSESMRETLRIRGRPARSLEGHRQILAAIRVRRPGGSQGSHAGAHPRRGRGHRPGGVARHIGRQITYSLYSRRFPMAQVTVEELLAKAKKPSEDAMKMHPFYKGKMQTLPRCAVRSFKDFAIWYTPGVAAPCKAIQANTELAYEYTSKWNTIAVVSDGTRVLGLGDIGPEAAMPVMEGKALLFKYLGGVDAVAICLKTKDADDIINTVRLIQPSFGGINLEDISQPKCFRVLDTLRADPERDDPRLAR